MDVIIGCQNRITYNPYIYYTHHRLDGYKLNYGVAFKLILKIVPLFELPHIILIFIMFNPYPKSVNIRYFFRLSGFVPNATITPSVAVYIIVMLFL